MTVKKMLFIPFLVALGAPGLAPSQSGREVAANADDIEREPGPGSDTCLHYNWKHFTTGNRTIENAIALPDGFKRLPAKPCSFAAWLRQLPLKQAGYKVHLYNGELKSNQSAHAAVIDIDVGDRDLQQCADAVMRLRAEYLYGQKRFSEIAFHYTSGDEIPFSLWLSGQRPLVKNNRVRWAQMGSGDMSYNNFRNYMNNIFTYAGTASLSKELKPVPFSEMRPG
ncbi:MAG: DUF4846 domain-containing protein, partial [Flavobacteriales bacterium]